MNVYDPSITLPTLQTFRPLVTSLLTSLQRQCLFLAPRPLLIRVSCRVPWEAMIPRHRPLRQPLLSWERAACFLVLAAPRKVVGKATLLRLGRPLKDSFSWVTTWLGSLLSNKQMLLQLSWQTLKGNWEHLDLGRPLKHLPCLALPCLHQTCAMLMGNPVQLHKGAQ